MPERRGEQNTSGHSNAHTENLNKCFGPNKDGFLFPTRKKQIILLMESGKKQVQHLVSSCFWRVQLSFFFKQQNDKWYTISHVISDPSVHWFTQVVVWFRQWWIGRVGGHPWDPSTTCVRQYSPSGVGSRFCKSWPSARVRWDFFIEMNHLYKMSVSKNNGTLKSSLLIGFSIINHPFWGTPIFGNTQMMSVVWLMAFTVWWTHHAAVHFFFGMSMGIFEGYRF